MFHKLAGKKSSGPKAFRARLLKDARMKNFVEKANAKGETPLMAACKALDKEMVAEGIAAGAQLDVRDAKGKTAWMHAGLKHGDKADKAMSPIVQMLLEAGADASIGAANGVSVGMAMAAGAPVDAIKALSAASPEQFDAQTQSGAKALAAVGKRGGKVLSAVEQALLGAQAGGEQAEEAVPAKKKRL